MTTKDRENYELVLYRLDEISSKQDMIDKKLDSIQRHYVTDERFEEFKNFVTRELRKKSFYNIINPIIASVSTAIVTFLIIEFLRRT